MKLKNLKKLSRPILITGHTGFKGTWMILLLEALGIEWVGLSLPPKADSLYSTVGLKNQSNEIFIDIRDLDLLLDAVNSTNPSVIIHLAAQPLVLESYDIPYETFSTNVIGTMNVLEAASKNKSTAITAVITTDKVYQNSGTKKRFKEQDKIGGNEPYSSSKAATESVITGWQQIYHQRGGSFPIALRAGNVIGGGDLAKNRLIPDIIRALQSRSTLKIRNPKSSRPWQHVLDPLYGYLLAIDKSIEDKSYGAFNFGPQGKSLKVQKVLDIAIDKWPKPHCLEIEIVNEIEYESKFLSLNSSLSNTFLNWSPKYSQIESVEITMEWWKNYLLNGFLPLDLCRKEVHQYLNLLNER
jgi:CDP-glucose 4,6-dehydratase